MAGDINRGLMPFLVDGAYGDVRIREGRQASDSSVFQCRRAIHELLTVMGHTDEDQRIRSVLIQGYPGSDLFTEQMFRGYLSQFGS